MINDVSLDKEITASTLEGITYVPLSKISDNLGIKVEQQEDTMPNVLLAGQIYDKSLNPAEAVEQPGAVNLEKSRRIAYLTFDDGLDSKVTPRILDILKHYDAKAAFFIIGNTVSKNKDTLKRMVDEGHKVGNHTYTHNRDIIYTDVNSFSKELAKTSKAVYDVTGITPNLFRPPYGAPYISDQDYKNALSQYKTVLWNVDSMDSRVKGISSSEIAAAVKSQVKGKRNAIILFHSTGARKETAEALPEIIQYLMDEGYTIASME